MSLHPSLRRQPQTPSDEFCHVVCCLHERLTLCGHLTDTEYADDGDEHEPMCVVCADLEPSDFCPARQQCPE